MGTRCLWPPATSWFLLRGILTRLIKVQVLAFRPAGRTDGRTPLTLAPETQTIPDTISPMTVCRPGRTKENKLGHLSRALPNVRLWASTAAGTGLWQSGPAQTQERGRGGSDRSEPGAGQGLREKRQLGLVTPNDSRRPAILDDLRAPTACQGQAVFPVI